MQLTLAVALHRHLLPCVDTATTSTPASSSSSSTVKLLAYDPEFAPGDVQLLNSLGFEVPGQEPNLGVSGPALYYMPCCPRQLYSDVLVSAGAACLHVLTLLRCWPCPALAVV